MPKFSSWTLSEKLNRCLFVVKISSYPDRFWLKRREECRQRLRLIYFGGPETMTTLHDEGSKIIDVSSNIKANLLLNSVESEDQKVSKSLCVFSMFNIHSFVSMMISLLADVSAIERWRRKMEAERSNNFNFILTRASNNHSKHTTHISVLQVLKVLQLACWKLFRLIFSRINFNDFHVFFFEVTSSRCSLNEIFLMTFDDWHDAF